ncbi:MAG TPA: hypothetical protein VFM98_23340 [Ramlibacter sp.]|uniref:hypothetical protein n=1 Tax=Ramlibacter sp. TaxID=1917967 RepID=UPI002D7F9DFD|nr:hypothetical protein [Ramlibacter sp.]HET8748548.1 hypothetical protein [Ramlibacter sp.]
MLHINEWDPVPWDVPLPEKGLPFELPAGTAGAIRDRLLQLAQDPPIAVHFFRGEGLRWIRVGFDKDSIRRPADVKRIGDAIRSALQPADGKLYFQALRAHDLLFFLDTGGDASTKGMDPDHFGEPLDAVLQAWA